MAYTNRGVSGRGRAALRAEGTAVPAPDAIAALARAGRHAEAIEQATRALDIACASAEDRMSYFELRLESRSALGQNDLAAGDAAAMVALADTTKSAALTARALIGRARVRIRRDNKDALALATAAAKVAVRSKDPRIVAHSLRLLAEAQARTGDSEAALANARKAVAAFERLRDIGGSGRAQWVIGLVNLVARRSEDAREAAGAALRASREAGDAYGEGNALNLLSQVGADLAEGIRLRQEAAAAFGRAGHIEQRMMMVGNLATSYQDLGLFHRARRLQGEVAETARAIGARGLLTYALGNRLDAELRLGLTEAATTRLAELAEQVAEARRSQHGWPARVVPRRSRTGGRRPGDRGRPLCGRGEDRATRGLGDGPVATRSRAVPCSRQVRRRLRSPLRSRLPRCIAPSISRHRTPRRRRRSGGAMCRRSRPTGNATQRARRWNDRTVPVRRHSEPP